MPQKFVNNLQAVLSADITSTTISIPVVSTAGFPTLGAGDWFFLTLTDKREGGEKRWEIVKVTAFSNNVLSVNRAQDGTTGQAWTAGSELSLRVTAGDMQSLKDGTTSAGDTVTLTGDVTGTATVSANGSISVSATVVDYSHNHTIANVDGLQDALNLKAPLDSPALAGTPTAPTAAVGTSTSQIATTAFVTAAMGDIEAALIAINGV